MSRMSLPRVLFADTDGHRSLMAAAILREHAGDRFEALCAATLPAPVSPHAVAALREFEILPKGLEVWQLGKPLPGDLAYAIALDEQVILPAAGRQLTWPMPDPKVVDSPESFRSTADYIEIAIFDWLTQFDEREWE